MTELSLTLPVLGQPDKTEDPKINNALKAIQLWANGNIDGKNLTAAYAAFIEQLIPTGAVLPYGGSVAPSSSWLLCDGSAVSRSTYSKLFQLVGTAFGEGDKVTTFNLPNMHGRVPVGAGTAVGASGATAHVLGGVGGEETHLLSGVESGVPKHVHGLGGATALTIGSGTEAYASGPATTGGITQTGDPFPGEANAAAAHNNMQPFTVLSYVIRT